MPQRAGVPKLQMHGILPGPSEDERTLPRYGATAQHTLPPRSLRRPRDAGAADAAATMRPSDMCVGASSPRRGAASGRRSGRLRDRAPTLAQSAATLSATGQLGMAIDEDRHSGARVNVRTSSMHHHHQKGTMHHTGQRILRRGEDDGGVFTQSVVDRVEPPDAPPITAELLFSRGADFASGRVKAQHIGWHGELVAGSKVLPFGEVEAGALTGKGGPMLFSQHVDHAKRHMTKLSSTNHR
jgi:hypothetical protein|eukprot:COSAG06_NODE_5142_length_3685_cov_44.518126_1_plen_241_part_00